MATPVTRILFVGDMHLGTRPTRLPAVLGDPDRYGPAAAWERTVTAAVERGVQAVALAGDVVNRRNALFEAARALRPGLERLAAAGIATFAVAGNHDTRALPGLVTDGVPLHLLGRGGTWEAVTVGGDDRPAVRLVGWSFPQDRWTESPLATPPPAADRALPTFGLLHADLDAAGSPYAPVASSALAAVGYDRWCLGHIHTPGALPQDGRPFYLGSLSSLDPTETGEHGPVLATVTAGDPIRLERLPVAPLRWEHWTLACPPQLRTAGDLQEFIYREVSARAAALAPAPDTALGLRVVLGGAVDDPAAVAAAAATIDRTPLRQDGVEIFVERIACRVRIAADLEALAQGTDPAGLLARHVLLLENGAADPAGSALLAELMDGLRTAAAIDLDETMLRQRGAAAARRLLDRLLGAGGRP
ncbi:MAG TPA: metallophosphoesterase [Candidatus Krumholzibacteria bacterium]|nr:metallophosphoesterase [Candidatus Krumholzibacteria bacterium]